MKHAFRVISVYILVLALLATMIGCTDNSKGKPDNNSSLLSATTDENKSEDKNNSNVSDVSENTDSSTNEEIYFTGTGNLNGTLTKVYQRDDAEVAGTTVNCLSPMLGKGGAEREANALRNNILSAKDTLEIKGTTYYFSTSGDNDNDGTSPESPLRTLDMLERIDLKEGDGVLLQRGCVFRISAAIRLVSGVSYGAYGEGSKPEIWGSEKNFAGKNYWKPYKIKNVWVAEYLTNDVGLIVFNNGENYARKQMYLRMLQKDLDFYYTSEGYVYLYSTSDPNTRFKSIEIGAKTNLVGLPSGVSNVVIDNWCLRYTSSHALCTAGDNRNIRIENCELGWIGGAIQNNDGNSKQRYGNAIEFWDSAEDVVVENCWIYHTFDAALTIQGNGLFKNVTFTNNLLEYNAFSVEWWVAKSNRTGGVQNFSITNNIMRFSGYGFESDNRSDIGRDAHLNVGSTIANKIMPIFKNYIVSGNIFDCSYTQMMTDVWDSTRWETAKNEYKFSNNTYYMRDRTGDNYLYGKAGNRMLCLGSEGIYSTASNQAELEAAVAVIEKNPKLVKWLDN